MELIDLILRYAIVPLFVWIWFADRKIVKLESQIVTKKDLDILFSLIRKLDDKMDNKFISVDSCNHRHKVERLDN